MCLMLLKKMDSQALLKTTSDITRIYKEHGNASGLPVFTLAEWKTFLKQFPADLEKECLVNYITENNIPFPLQEISRKEIVSKFYKLKSCPLSNFLSPTPAAITDKFNDYKYQVSEYCKTVLELGHYYNNISNYFHQETRLRCDGYDTLSPLNTWKDAHALKKFNWTFWRPGDIIKKIDPGAYREAFRLGAYTATQFKPHVAKYMYDRFNAKAILDSSCGWGDRLAGFYASDAETYVGCDPNPATWNMYIEQCIFYEKLLGDDWNISKHDNYFTITGNKEVIIYCEGSENVEWPHLDYNLAFTSPPYFGTERYAEGSNDEKQSWFKYPKYEDWLSEYLFKTLDNISKVIAVDGAIAINIIDAKIKNKRYNICDPMTEYMNSIDMPLQEVVGMRMMPRPKNEEGGNIEHMQECFVEPIWIYSAEKANIETPFDRLFVM